MKKILNVFLISHFSFILAIGQLNPEYWINSGRDKIINKEDLSAIEYFNTILRFVPDLDEAYYLRGISKFDLKDYRGAISDFTSAIKINSIYSEYYLFRGNAKEKLLDFKL